MIPDRYVWLAWSGLFLLSWAVLYGLCPRCRPLMLWSSLLTLPFGLSEPFFLGHYWDPPSLFDLTRVVHCDLETFIFCFGIGGVAAAAFHVLTGRPVQFHRPTEHDLRFDALHALALLAPIPVFVVVLVLTQDLIWAGVGGFAAGAAARMASRPDLAAKVGIGGLLFFTYYVGLLLLLKVLAPGYLERYWNMSGPAGTLVFGLPMTELLFAFGFGLYLSGLYEQIDWALSAPGRESAAAEAFAKRPAIRGSHFLASGGRQPTDPSQSSGG